MNTIDTAKTVVRSIENSDFDTAMGLLTNNFTLAGPVPQPINAQQWLGLHRILNAAMPDFSFNLSGSEVSGNKVTLTVQISGTQQNTLDLSPMEMPTVPATSIRVQLPVERLVLTFEGDKISAINVAPVPGGGLAGILSQLGVEMPH